MTGGGGFLARYVVEKLLEKGWAVRSFSRNRYPQLEAMGVACHCGDLRSAEAVADAVEGVEIVYHIASLAAMWGRHEDFYGINVKGTENVLAACRRHGIRKLVYTSTPSVVFPMGDLEGVDESQPYPDSFMAAYPATKALAEQAVLQANGPDLSTCALRPHLIWGPRDTHIVPMLAERARTGKLVKVGDGTNRVDLTYVENAATAHLLAGARLAPDAACAGKAYFISDGAPVNMWDWIQGLLDQLELPGPSKTVSAKTAYRLGAFMELVYRALPFLGEPRLTRFLASNFATSHYFDISAACRDLGYSPSIDNAEGLRRTVAWYKDHVSEGGDHVKS